MTANQHPPLQVVAMHGWGRDARTWEPWQKATDSRGWLWHTGERGYGALPPRVPAWPGPLRAGRRLVIGRSLGPHMIPANVLAQADAVVLLVSFATFVPPGREGRRLRAALTGMAASLEDEVRARDMLGNFTAKVAEPQSADLLPPGPLDGPLDEANRARLRQDIDLLAGCHSLPAGFPLGARVLIVEAGSDRIVEPQARTMLRAALPAAEVRTLPGIGHALLSDGVMANVIDWVESWRDAED